MTNTSDVTVVEQGGKRYAMFIRQSLAVDGVKFLTKDSDDFQLGVMERPKGHVVQPHRHPEQKKEISTLSEFLYIEKGKIKVTVFDDAWSAIHEEILGAGDFLLLFTGGHSVEFLEATRMIEVKQGPFAGDAASKVYQQPS